MVLDDIIETKHTFHGDKVPEVVGSIDLPYHFKTHLLLNAAPRLLNNFIKEMHPSRGEHVIGSKFGGIYMGNYYEACVNPEQIDIWAYNENTAKEISNIFAVLQ